MREIKFRAWTTYAVGMFRWEDPGQAQIIAWHLCGECVDMGIVSIMQYTGLKDKNGKEIYEDDIVKFTSAGKEYQRPVVWNPAGMWSIDWSGTPNQGPLRNEYEVVGNIHENSDLIK